MRLPDGLSRRELLRLGAACGGIACVARALAAVTPELTIGPFYPRTKPLDQDVDLTRVAGREGRAAGRLLHVTGRVRDGRGRPIEGAHVEIWQTNSYGRYHHPQDSNPAPLDPSFQGYGVAVTNAEGRYGFTTIRPAPYPVGRRMRTPHIHFQVSAAGERSVTQMFFPDEELNARDRILNSVPEVERALLFARLESDAPGVEAGATLATFNIVLARG